MKKAVRILAVAVIVTAVLSLFGWMSVQIANQERYFGSFTDVIKQLYSFPELLFESVEEVKTLGLPKTFIKTSDDFVPINSLDHDLMVLVSYSDVRNSRSVSIINLRTDSVHWKWNFTDSILEHERIFHPLLLPDGTLVYSFNGKSLTRVDSSGQILWDQDSIWPHHSKELDADGNIWLSTYPTHWKPSGTYKINGSGVYYHDEFITNVDANTGEILFHRSMTDILVDNGLENYLLKSGNLSDPIHTNDVQPALRTTPFYQKGDLFISTKSLSVILHYRPSTNKVIDVIEGPFVAQHDPDFLGDSSLIFFNNNYYTGPVGDSWPAPKDSTKMSSAGSLFSNIVEYDFASKTFKFVADSVFRANRIFSRTEGLIDFYRQNTVFVEQQNFGVLWVIQDNEVVYKNVLRSQHEGYHHLPNWTRVLTDQ